MFSCLKKNALFFERGNPNAIFDTENIVIDVMIVPVSRKILSVLAH